MTMQEKLKMTVKEAERLGIMKQVDKKEFTLQQASEQMGVGFRQGKRIPFRRLTSLRDRSKINLTTS